MGKEFRKGNREIIDVESEETRCVQKVETVSVQIKKWLFDKRFSYKGERPKGSEGGIDLSA